MLDDDDLIIGTKTVVRPFWKRLFVGALSLIIIGAVGGFILFTSQIAAKAPALATISKADGIVVLTGGQTRIEHSFALLLAGKGDRLLVSGVDQSLDKEGLRDLTGGSAHDDAAAKFDCCVDIEHVAGDTEGNAQAAAKWATDNQFTSLIMVTSAYHVPRAQMIFKARIPGVEITAYPVPSEAVPAQEWYKYPRTTLFLMDEYAKTLWSWVTIKTGQLMGDK